MSLQKAIDVAKSNQGFFGALAGSKKFSITMIFASAALTFATDEKEPWVRAALILGGMLLVGVYVVAQSSVERRVAAAAESDILVAAAPEEKK